MSCSRLGSFFLLPLALAATVAVAAEPDYDRLQRIRQAGFTDSRVLELAEELTDSIGARLTGSPALRQANAWARDHFTDWGLANVHDEAFDFGEGWSFEAASVRQVAPYAAVLHALPRAWTPGTDGVVRGPVRRVKIEEVEDLEPLRGEVRGMILLLDDAAEPRDPGKEEFARHDEDDLAELARYPIPTGDGPGARWRAGLKKRLELGVALNDFVVEEGVLATVEVSSFGHGIVRVAGAGSYGLPGQNPGVTGLTMAAEHYGRLLRLLERDVTPELEIEVRARFHDEDDGRAYNTLAEIPGAGRDPEIVMAGAHLDSWHAGSGATDDGAGVVVVMEAARILAALDARPQRSIRFALWGGEEQGLLGSQAHVEQHYARRPYVDDPEQAALPARYRERGWPIETLPDHRRFSVYFNIDNGGGALRGLWAQDNLGAKARFEEWIAPLADLGITTVTMRPTGSTDHIPFDRVGLPGFQFIQDIRDYSTRTHHSALDTFEYLDEVDLKQASVVLASLLWEAANDPRPFPRKAMPQEPPRREREEKAAAAEPEAPAQDGAAGTQAAAEPTANPADTADPAAVMVEDGQEEAVPAEGGNDGSSGGA